MSYPSTKILANIYRLIIEKSDSVYDKRTRSARLKGTSINSDYCRDHTVNNRSLRMTAQCFNTAISNRPNFCLRSHRHLWIYFWIR